MKQYEVSVHNIFDAEDETDAVVQMAEWLAQNARTAGYRAIAEDDPGEGKFIDAEDAYWDMTVRNDVE